MILIIAEKNSVMKKIAQALEPSAIKRNGYMEGKQYIFTHCVGHLLTLELPKNIDEKYSSWKLDTLPFHFENIPSKIPNNTEVQTNIVIKLLQDKRITEIVNACDADREGELIFREIYFYSKSTCSCTSRMWIETMSSNEALLNCFNNRKDGVLYLPLYYSALCRQYADYHIGINSTIGMTSAFSNTDFFPNNDVLSLGRVQTPTLRMIVDLHNEILNFIPKTFYTLSVSTDRDFDASFVDGQSIVRFDSRQSVDDKVKEVGLGRANVESVETTTRRDGARKLFNLSDLQIHANKKKGYTANDVLESCQRLYEHYGLITYPRTDENKISPETANASKMIVNGLPSLFYKQKEYILNNNREISKNVIAGKDGIGSHEALTPVPERQINENKINELNEIDFYIYQTIVERYLSNFYEPAVYEKQTIILEKNNNRFKTSIENLIEYGHLDAYSSFGGKEQIDVIKISKGENVMFEEHKIHEGKTSAPERFTEGTLIAIMKKPYMYVSNDDEKDTLKEIEGIGTEATRASIIEELKKRKYISIEKNKIYPTDRGVQLINVLPSEIIKSVSLTAQLEKKLSMIAKNNYTKEKFFTDFKKINEEFISSLKQNQIEKKAFNYNVDNRESICTCPSCGNQIFYSEKKEVFYCSGEKCKFSVSKNYLKKFDGPKITKTLLKELIKNNVSSKTYTFFSERKQTYFEAKINLTIDKTKEYPVSINFQF